MLTQLGNMILASLVQQGLLLEKTPDSDEMKRHSTGPQSVTHVEHSHWMVKNEFLEARASSVYDLESEIEVLQSQEEKLFTKFTAHWTIRGLLTATMTFEFMD